MIKRFENEDFRDNKDLDSKRRALVQVIKNITEQQKKLYTKRADISNDKHFYEEDTKKIQNQLSFIKIDPTYQTNIKRYQEQNIQFINKKFRIIKPCDNDLYKRVINWMIKKVFYLQNDQKINQFTQQTIKAGLLSYKILQVEKIKKQLQVFQKQINENQISLNEEPQTLTSTGLSPWQYQIKLIKSIFSNKIAIAQYKDLLKNSKKSHIIDLKNKMIKNIQDNKMELKILKNDQQIIQNNIELTQSIKNDLKYNLKELQKIIEEIDGKQKQNDSLQSSQVNISTQRNRRKQILSNNFNAQLISKNKLQQQVRAKRFSMGSSTISKLSASGPVKHKLQLTQNQQIAQNPQNINITKTTLYLSAKNKSQRLMKQQQQIAKINLIRSHSIQMKPCPKQQPKKRFLECW